MRTFVSLSIPYVITLKEVSPVLVTMVTRRMAPCA